VGPHIADFVSFPLRTVLDLVPARESEAAAATRAEKREWLAERDYRVIEVSAAEVETDVRRVLDQLEAAIAMRR
jgi:tRNA/rRNA methyltransferase